MYRKRMGRARQDIVGDHSLIHVTFRCHNKEFYFHSDEMKKYVYKILCNYRKRFDIHVFDWVIMSNHVHLLVYTPDRETLSRFMHSSNLAVAKLINREFKKRGQAIEDRFKSPVIENESYMVNTIGYIWLNPFRAGMVGRASVGDYRYSSLFYKLRGLADRLCSSYHVLKKVFGFCVTKKSKLQRFAMKLLQKMLSKEWCDSSSVFEALHSIGSEDYCKARRPITRLRSG